MSSEVAVRAVDLGKCFQIYDKPSDRLKQTLWRGRRRYYREFWALRDVALEVQKGETLGIIGQNGSGKSTLLQLLAGTLTPTSGSVDVNGRVAALLELGAGFNPEFTGRENVYLNGAILGISRQEMERRFEDIAAFADIGDFIDQPTKMYSSGMLVRLAFAVSINVEPDILIVDEALAVGDAGFQFKCLERLDALTKSGVTLLFVSHSIEMVKTFCNCTIYLEAGKVKARGAPDEIAELYLFDVRAAQQKSSSGGSRLSWKPPLYSSGHSAFGTEDGRIVSAGFVHDGDQTATFTAGDMVRIVVEVEFKRGVRSPHLALLLQDARMMHIGGRAFPLRGREGLDEMLRARVQCSFVARLSAGNYFLTLRLEDRTSEELFFPLDKQSGLLSFQVHRRSKEILGSVDLDVRMDEVASTAGPVSPHQETSPG